MRHEIATWSLVSLAAFTALAYSAYHARGAHRDLQESQARLDRTRRTVESLTALQSAVPIDQKPSRTDPGLAARATSTLERIGLSAGTLSAFSAEPDVLVGSAGDLRVTRSRATISLVGLSLPQVGLFLDAWRKAEPKWIPISIELSPDTTRMPHVAGDLPLRIVILVEALHVYPIAEGK